MTTPAANAVKIPDSVTICVTSCGRLDLLAQTLAAFRTYNLGGTFLISEDSTNAEVIAKAKQDYPFATILSGPNRLGIMGSIDRLYSEVKTPYIFHLEDDWEFFGPIDWEAAIEALETRADIVNVCVRSFTEVKPKYGRRSDRAIIAGAELAVMRIDSHPEFYSWSPNPGIIKYTLYEQYKPFSRVMPDQMSGVMKKDGKVMAYLLPGVATHIGQGRNVTDPTMPPRPKSKIGKWMRGIKKKLYYAGLRKSPF